MESLESKVSQFQKNIEDAEGQKQPLQNAIRNLNEIIDREQEKIFHTVEKELKDNYKQLLEDTVHYRDKHVISLDISTIYVRDYYIDKFGAISRE